MRRDSRVAAVPAFEDDATAVDHTVSDRARSDLHSIHEATTVSKRLSFDDMPTTVWTPQPPKPAPGTSSIRVSTRRLRSVDTGPNVQVQDVLRDENTTISAGPVFHDENTTISPGPVVRTENTKISAGPVVRVSKTKVSYRDEVTRIEAPVPLPSTLLPTREEPTAPGVMQRRMAEFRRHLPVRIAMGIVLAVLAAMAFVAFQRKHAHISAATVVAIPVAATPAIARPPVNAVAPVVAAPRAPLAPPASASGPAVAAPAPKAEPVKADATKGAPGTVVNLVPSAPAPSNDELAAVDAVQTGNVVRAARLYAALAAAHPTNDAYREAARILLEGSKESHP